MSIQTVGIIGAGTMGNGIAQACAVSGIPVVMVDISEAAVAKGIATVSGSLDRLVKKEKISEADKAKALGLIKGSTSYDDLKATQLVIEAATENQDLKVKILKQVDGLLAPDVIVASNTSSISITRLAASTDRPEKFIGIHFMNPVPIMQLVELIRGIATSNETYEQVKELTAKGIVGFEGLARRAVEHKDGFGIAFHQGQWVKIAQLGGVRIGDDCEIGANTTIDRGAIDDTIVENDVKLDNQIQVGHNCRIGAHSAIAGCTGIGWCANGSPVDNSAGADGDKTVDVWQGDMTCDNATAGTAVGATGLGGAVYADGRQSVTVSSAGRSKAGIAIGLPAGNLGGVMLDIESKGA